MKKKIKKTTKYYISRIEDHHISLFLLDTLTCLVIFVFYSFLVTNTMISLKYL